MCEYAIRIGTLQTKSYINAKSLTICYYNNVSYGWTLVLYVHCWHEIINLIYRINEKTLGPN